ncbi:hypothetical protein V3851_09285 [Paenibacillus sp. M1]|uniref:Uncharacterized protein n=1 Tax=Paenibacillus haidiansis TaxID=1574488 RepID=A0ABU7VQL2_9BACL
MNKSKGYFYYLLWILGALVLVYYGNRFVGAMEQNPEKVLKISYGMLGNLLYGLVLGAYVSLLGGLPNRRKFQRPLFFFVFLPSLILMLYPVLNLYLNMPYYSLYKNIAAQEGHFFFTLLCGLSLMKSLFGSR